MDISVIIPVYNAASYLSQCLASVSSSSASIEILCLDDGSTDESLEIMQNASMQDDRIVIISKPNEGYGATLNRGISIARGRYIAIVEPDDFLDGDMFSVLLELASKNNYPDVVKSAYWNINEIDGKKTHCGYWRRVKPTEQPLRIEKAPLLLRYHPSIWSALYRKDFLANNRIAFVEAPGAGWVDNPFMVEVMIKAESIVYTDRSFYCYREDRIGSSSSLINDFRIPLDRWHEMTDTVEASDIQNVTILGIHAYRAFFYLQVARKAVNFDEGAWNEKAKTVMLRLRPDIVARSPYVSPKNKKLFEQLTGNRLSNISNMPYYRMLVKEAFWKIRQNGIRFFACRMRSEAK